MTEVDKRRVFGGDILPLAHIRTLPGNDKGGSQQGEFGRRLTLLSYSYFRKPTHDFSSVRRTPCGRTEEKGKRPRETDPQKAFAVRSVSFHV